jgi:hypothetical protein
MEDFIDSAIAEAKAASTETAQPEVTDAPQEENTNPTDATEQGNDDVVFPKKAVNAISRRDRTIGKLRAESEALRAELAKLQQPVTKESSNDGKPNESDFSTYGDYLEALQDWKVEKKLSTTFAEREAKTKQAQVNSEMQAWKSERETNMAAQAQELIKSAPDYHAVLAANADILDALPGDIQDVLLEIDNAPLAVFNLAKEGKLEALATMTPIRAAMELSRASAQAVKPQTKAPHPLSPARGAASSSKSLDQMKADELVDKWLKS